MEYPLVSIVVPVYNAEKFLRKTLDCICSQSYPNLEIVLADDESTDSSPIIMSEYAEKDNRIKVFRIQHTGTPKGTRDTGISKSQGSWIVAIDSDDTVEDIDFVNKLYARQLETGADFVGARMCVMTANNEISFSIPDDSFDYNQVLTGEEAMAMTLRKWEISTSGALMRRSLIDNLVTNPASKIFSDECDSRRYLLNSKKVAFVETDYYVSFNPNSTGRKVSPAMLNYNLLTAIGVQRLMEEKSLTQYYPLTVKNVEIVFRSTLRQLIERRSGLKQGNLDNTFKYLQDSLAIMRENVKNRAVIPFYKALLCLVRIIY